MPYLEESSADESKDRLTLPHNSSTSSAHSHFNRPPPSPHDESHLIVSTPVVTQYISSSLTPRTASSSASAVHVSASASASALPLLSSSNLSSASSLALTSSPPSPASPSAIQPPITSIINAQYVCHVDTLSRCVLFANSDNPRLIVAHKLNKLHTDAYDDALMSAMRQASIEQERQREQFRAGVRSELDGEPNPFEQDSDGLTASARFHTRDSSAAPLHFTSQHTHSPIAEQREDIDDSFPTSPTQRTTTRLPLPQSSSTSQLNSGVSVSPQPSPVSSRQATFGVTPTPSVQNIHPIEAAAHLQLHVDPTASPRYNKTTQHSSATADDDSKHTMDGQSTSTDPNTCGIRTNTSPQHVPGDENDEWTVGEQNSLAEQILLMYVELFWQNPKAFAPFYRRRMQTWRDKATLVYEHLLQSRHKESHINRWRRQWNTRHIRKRMIAFFEQELVRLDLQSADPAHPQHHRNHRMSLVRERQERAASTARLFPNPFRSTPQRTSRRPSVELQEGPGRPSLRRQLTQAELSVPLTAKDQTTIPPPTDAYFSRLNEVCSALHARYVEVSEAVGTEIVDRLLTPALPESIVDAAALNREVVAVMHSPRVLPLLLSYHPEYQHAALGFPGLILMSRTLRRQLENPSLEFEQLQLTDLIVAVNDLTETLRTAFHKLVARQPALLEQLVTQKRFKVLRKVREAEEVEVQRERERGKAPYPGSFSFWLYDSQLYPRRFNNESLNVLRHVNKQDSRIFYLVAAHRFEQAAKRLKQLNEHSKALWLEMLMQRRKQESRDNMVGISSTTSPPVSGLKPQDSTQSLTGKMSTARSPATNPLPSPHDALLSPSSGGEEMEAAAQNGRGELMSDEYEDITAGRPEYYGAKVIGMASHTTYGHIHKWVDISAQYVVGLGRNETTGELEPWAVYDKTFNEPLFHDLWTTLKVGFMTRENIHNHQLELKRMKRADTVQQFLTNVLFSSNATTSQSINVSAEFFNDPLLIWKDGKRPSDIDHPTRPIAFDDFEWLQMFISHPELQPLITCVADLNDLVNPRSVKRWPLHHCYFQRQEDGSYRLPLNRSKTIQPVKVIDIKFPQSSFQPAVTRAIFTNAIKGGLSGIPFYGPTQTMSALLERVFDFTDILYLQRHHQVQQMVMEALDGSDTSPFSHPVFTTAMLESAVFYLLRTNIMLSGVIVNSVTANATLATSYIKKVDFKRQQGIEMLEKRGFTVLPLPNSYYSLSYMRDPTTGHLSKLKLHSLGFRKIARSKKPHAAVDLFRPHRERRKRLVLQYLLTIANFFYVPIPAVGGVCKMIYKEVFVREIHKRQMWEAGLLGHIQHNPGQLSGLLQSELRMNRTFAEHVEAQCILILEERRLSPFDLSQEEKDHHRAIVETWIRQHDPDYTSLHPVREKRNEAKTHDVRPPDRTPAVDQPAEPQTKKGRISKAALME